MKMAIWKQLPGSSSLHGGTLLLLFNVLDHIVIWQKVRWVLNTLILSVLPPTPQPPAIMESIFSHIDECVSCPDRRKGTEWLAFRNFRRQGRSESRQPGSAARHQDATEKAESSYRDASFRLIHLPVGAILCFQGLLYGTRNETEGRPGWAGCPCLPVSSWNIW